MKALRHWLTELAEVYARHAARHGPHRLLPAAVLPAHGRVPEHAGPSPQGSGPDESTAEPSAPTACTRTRIDAMEEHARAREARHGAGDNEHGAINHDRRREEMHHLETALRSWQARWHHTPGPSDPGTPRRRDGLYSRMGRAAVRRGPAAPSPIPTHKKARERR
jgi:hypothetical protein